MRIRLVRVSQLRLAPLDLALERDWSDKRPLGSRSTFATSRRCEAMTKVGPVSLERLDAWGRARSKQSRRTRSQPHRRYTERVLRLGLTPRRRGRVDGKPSRRVLKGAAGRSPPGSRARPDRVESTTEEQLFVAACRGQAKKLKGELLADRVFESVPTLLTGVILVILETVHLYAKDGL